MDSSVLKSSGGNQETSLVERCAIAARWPYGVVVGLYDPGASLYEIVCMVKQIKHLSLQLDLIMLGNVKRSGQSKINFINQRAINSIVTSAGHATRAGETGSGVPCRFDNRTVIQGVISTGAAICKIRAGTGARKHPRIRSAGIELHYGADRPV